MIQRYFTEPYRFIPPYRSTFWCRILAPCVPTWLRFSHRVARCQFEGMDLLRTSLDRGAGILLAANHCRRADPIVLGMLGLHLRQYFYYLVAFHHFKQSRFLGWIMNRMGGYSVWREGGDRESLRAGARILAGAQRPIVVFPEGTWFRQNDRLGQIQDGLSLITRHAARQSSRPIVVHPVAIKYWLLEDPRPMLRRRLEALEKGLSWQPQEHLELIPRIQRLASALLGLKEIEHEGATQGGTLDERIRRLADAHITSLEKSHLGTIHADWILKRIRRLRQVLVRHLTDGDDPGRVQAARRDLDLLMFCENLTAHSEEYLHERPSLERLTETVQRIEETVNDDVEIPVAPVGAMVTVGEALEVRDLARSRRQSSLPIVPEVADGIQGLLDAMLQKGPPPEWNCPAPIEPAIAMHLNGKDV